MYLQFYNLNEFPFTITCDPRFFYESADHAEALANMVYTVQQRKGLVVVTGEIGAGKTLLSHVLQSRLGPASEPALVRDPPASGKQLVRALASRMGLEADRSVDLVRLQEQVEDHLVHLHNRGRVLALIVDEAQALGPEALEQARMLWNWERDGVRLMQIVLIGQPDLRDRLREPQWEPLRQRVALSYHLGPLALKDTAAYVAHRLNVASEGNCRVQFSEDALRAIHEASDGIPRQINTLCDNALLVGYAKDARVIDGAVIDEVLRDMTL